MNLSNSHFITSLDLSRQAVLVLGFFPTYVLQSSDECAMQNYCGRKSKNGGGQNINLASKVYILVYIIFADIY